MTKESTSKFLRRATVRTAIRRFLSLAILFGAVYGLTVLTYASQTIFKVKLNYAMVLEQLGGERRAVTEMVNNSLYYGVSEEKGVVLNGPPGSGKTFLVRVWLSENDSVHDLAVRPSDLQDSTDPLGGMAKNLDTVYDTAKMIAPSVVFFDEGDALAPRRSSTGGSPTDKLTNKFLNIIDGETPLNRVFTILTTNRLDILDPALVRSKRLKVLEISGHLATRDVEQIISAKMEGYPLEEGLTVADVMNHVTNICNTPADYAAFVEKALSLRDTEFAVIRRMIELSNSRQSAVENFIKFNFKTIKGALEVLNISQPISPLAGAIYEQLPPIVGEFKRVVEKGVYPLTNFHLATAHREMAESPTRKGKVELDEFLEAELSQEPQVGFIIGVGASEVSGALLPIASTLVYNASPDRIMVTGAVSSSAPNAAELDMAVQMTQQSAKEAFTLVENYLQQIAPKVSMARVLGEFLDHYTIHHQLLSASFAVGGHRRGTRWRSTPSRRSCTCRC